MLMQNIWLEKTDWDETVTPTTLDRWNSFLHQYQEINNIRIPRWVHYSPTNEVELHGFCDASEKAYGAAVYLRVWHQSKAEVNLLLAKTRVAPVKTISLPRLELCGDVLLAEIIESVTEGLDLGHFKVYLWTDSTIVLAWIRKPPCSWSTFVAHRITKIVEKVGTKNWSHVDSASNPADLASRGLPAYELVNNCLWWQGTSWLQEDSSNWPTQNSDYKTQIEEKRIQAHAVTINKQNVSDLLDRFSDLPRALRVISYVMRFYQRTHSKTKSYFQAKSCLISSSEIKATTQRLIQLSQKQHFGEEYKSLRSGESIDGKSEILSLNPFIDESTFIRVGGRLGASLDLAYNERHPIILPYDCRLSRLIVQFIHKVSLHGENQLMLRIIRTQYWIPRVKNMIRSVIHNCKICTIHKKRTQTQLMGILRQERTTYSRAFTNSGVDFAGPFDIKSYRGRGCRISKGYVCLFVCFATKAIHLEATSDLTTASFLAAFARFTARRGCPQNMYSDNGTNFVGASRSLRSEAKAFMIEARNSTLSKYAHQVLSWHFIPAAAPHMGGLWEAGVKSFKSHFTKIASNYKYTFEEFTTLLCRIESCLNSRPISPSSNDPSDLEPLTPGHFLVGGPLLAPPEPDSNENPASIVNRWQKLKALHQNFCRRWKSEYLSELQKRIKWKYSMRNLEVGDLVVIKEENLAPNAWRLGRVTNLHPGSDNRVRVVELATEKGQTTRPIAKLVLLPPHKERSEDATNQ